MIKLIILIGRRRVGKDTSAEIIRNYYGKENVNILTLSSVLKYILSKTLNISIDRLDSMKNNNEFILENETRNVMINFSDTMLELFGKNLWCEFVEKCFDNNKINIITDVRYKREIDFFSKYDPITIKITRNNSDNFSNEQETDSLPATFIVNNSKKITDLEENIHCILSLL